MKLLVDGVHTELTYLQLGTFIYSYKLGVASTLRSSETSQVRQHHSKTQCIRNLGRTPEVVLNLPMFSKLHSQFRSLSFRGLVSVKDRDLFQVG